MFGKLLSLWVSCEHVVWNLYIEKIVFFYSFGLQFFKCSTELAMHSTHCHRVQGFVFHTSASKTLRKASFTQTAWMIGLSARSPQRFTCKLNILSNIFLAQELFSELAFYFERHKAKGLSCSMPWKHLLNKKKKKKTVNKSRFWLKNAGNWASTRAG